MSSEKNYGIRNNGAGTINITDAEISASGPLAAIYNNAAGKINITDASISGNGTYAVQMNSASGSLTLDGDPTINGAIRIYTGQLKVPDTFAPGQTYVLDVVNPVTGAAVVKGGAGYLENFTTTYTTKHFLDENGDDIILIDTAQIYRIIKGAGSSFTAQRDIHDNGTWYDIPGGVDVTIQNAVNAIKAQSDGKPCDITFWGDGSEPVNTLNPGSAMITFNGDGFGWNATLYGTLASAASSESSAAIILTNGANITSRADVSNTGTASAFRNTSSGTLTIESGNVSGKSYHAIVNNGNGTLNIYGGTISTSSTLAAAITNQSAGPVNIIGDVTVTNAGWNVNNSGAGTITISGGTFTSTNAGYPTLFNNGMGTMNITDAAILSAGIGVRTAVGTVNIKDSSISAGAHAIYISGAAGRVSLDGAVDVNRNLFIFPGTLSVSEGFEPSSVYVLEISDPAAGAVIVNGGAAFRSSFDIILTKFAVGTADGNIVLTDDARPDFRIINGGTSGTFTAQRDVYGDGAWKDLIGGVSVKIQDAVDKIKADAEGKGCTLTFWGNGAGTDPTELSIGSSMVTFDGRGVGWDVTLFGSVTSFVSSSSFATITVSNDAKVTSYADISNTTTGYGHAIRNDGTSTLNLFGGTITSSGSQQTVINYGTGTITIAEDTAVRSVGSTAVMNNSTGKIKISGNVLIESTVHIAVSNASGETEITGGTITSASGYSSAVSNGTGTLSISGAEIISAKNAAVANQGSGTINIKNSVLKAGTYAINMTDASGSLNLDGTLEADRKIGVFAGQLSLAKDFNPMSNVYELELKSPSAGATAVLNGAKYFSSFENALTAFMMVIGGDDIVLKGTEPIFRIIHGTGQGLYTAQRDILGNGTSWKNIPNATDVWIQFTIDRIKADAGGKECSLTFWGDGSGPVNTLTVGSKITFTGREWNVRMDGSLITDYDSIFIQLTDGANVTSVANIDTKFEAIRNSSTGTLRIEGGIISSGSWGIINDGAGTTLISGDTVIETRKGGGTALYNRSAGTMIVSGGTFSAQSLNSPAVSNGDGGTMIIYGGTFSQTSDDIPLMINSGTAIITGGTFTQNGRSSTVQNSFGGTIEISGGTFRASEFSTTIKNNNNGTVRISGSAVVESMKSVAVSNEQSGNIIITGGTIISFGTTAALMNNGPGTIYISGGTVENAGTDSAISIMNGKVIISESDKTVPTIITSSGYFTIYVSSYAPGAVILEITGGTIRNTGEDIVIAAIHHYSTAGIVDISGGTVESVGTAIRIQRTGTLNISGDAVVRGGNEYAINVQSTGTVNISGGKISSEGAHAIFMNIAGGSLTLSGTPEISGAIRSYAGTSSAQLSVLPGFSPGANVHRLDIANPAAGMTAVTGGAEFRGNFYSIAKNFMLDVSGSDLVLTPGHEVKVTAHGEGDVYVSVNGGAPFRYETEFKAAPGSAVEFTTFTATGHAFHHWSVGKEGYTDEAISLTVTQDTDVHAFFRDPSKNDHAEITTVSNPVTGGSVTWSYEDETGATVSFTGGGYVPKGTDVTFTAPVNEGYEFGGWAGGLSGFQPEATALVSGDMNITATFTVKTYNVTVDADNMTSDAPASIGHGDTLTFTFKPNTGYALPKSIVVIIDGRALSPGEYTYDDKTGYVTIPGITGGITITTSATRTYTVVFDPNNGFDPTWFATVPAGTPVANPGDLTWYGWTFLGWFDGETKWEFTDGVGRDMGLVASWEYNDAHRWTITFDPDNGKDTWTESVIKGGPAMNPGNPAWHGWTFLGWFAGDTKWEFTNIPNGNTTLTAKWEFDMDQRFTVTFDPNNGGKTWSETVPKNTLIADPGDLSWYAWTFLGWFSDSVLWTFTETVNGDITLTGKWMENMDERATVLFVHDNGTGTVLKVTVPLGTKVARPVSDPFWYGWTFLGWYSGDTKWDFTQTAEEDLVLTAKWEMNMNERFTVTFNPNNGGKTQSVTVPKNTPAARPADDPTWFGWSFDGWFNGNTQWNFDSPVYGNMTIAAKWTENPDERFKVTFDHNDGTGSATEDSVPKGTPAKPIPDLSWYGWTFLGWYNGDTKWEFTQKVDADLILTAKWTENHDERWTVKFDPRNDGKDKPWEVSVVKGKAVQRPAEDPAWYGWNFVGWFVGPPLWNFDNPVNGNISILGQWEEDPYERWKITFDPVNGDTTAVSVPKGTPVKPIPEPKWYGWIFDGWYIGDTKWEFTQKVDADITLTAKWTENPDERWTVKFDPRNDGKDESWEVSVIKGKAVQRPAQDPAWHGWNFVGWFVGPPLWNFDNPVNGNITILGQWEEDPDQRWKITFDPVNGATTAVSVPKGTPVKPIPEPKWYGWIFDGWYNGDTKWEFTQKVDADITLTAKWIENPDERWTVTFDPNNDEDPIKEVSIINGRPAERPAEDPKRPGWNFVGWFTAEGLVWEFDDPVYGKMTLTAKWAEDPGQRWTVTFDPVNGDTTAVSVPKGTPVKPIPEPKWYGWTFAGWFIGDDEWNFGDPVDGNITLTAKWDVNMGQRYTVTFDLNNGEEEREEHVVRFTPVGRPVSDPVLVGYTFIGWHLEGKVLWNFDDPVNDPLTLVAMWTLDTDQSWAVIFDPKNGDQAFIKYAAKGNPIAEPDEPKWYGWTFAGWYNGEDEWNFGDPVNGNMTLTAKWAVKMSERFTVTFILGNGNEPLEITIPTDVKLSPPAEPSWFGW
ncbi:MAG: InlB B-repeat-containing protein, partial [Methanomassiliicoccaceae archaeon]|nr:InlB B-repeat-containing protein [Methanomassiliicoccaceae archaeon]